MRRRPSSRGACSRHKGHDGHNEESAIYAYVSLVSSVSESAMESSYELLTRRSQSDHRQGPEHGEGRRRRSALLRRRAVGDALRELDDHREPRRARSGSADHRLLRPEVGDDLDAPVRRCVAEVGDRAGAGAGEAAARQPRADAAGEAAAGLPADRRRRCRRRSRSGRPSARGWSSRASTSARRRACSAPATSRSCTGPTRSRTPRGSSPTTATPRRASSSPAARRTAPDPGWAGTTGLKDISKIDAAALTEIAADKALKSRKPKALEPGNYTVILESRPAARFLSLMMFALNARAGRRRAQLHERQGARRHQARPEDLRRQRHHSQRRRQRRPAADAGRPGRPRGAADHLGRKGRGQEPLLRSLLGEEAEQAVHADQPEPEPGDGRRRRDRRADDQVDQARPARQLLLVHPRRSSR